MKEITDLINPPISITEEHLREAMRGKFDSLQGFSQIPNTFDEKIFIFFILTFFMAIIIVSPVYFLYNCNDAIRGNYEERKDYYMIVALFAKLKKMIGKRKRTEDLVPLKLDGSIHVKDLSLKQKNSLIFEPVSFSINPGERVAIVGASGSGKSSLFGIFTNILNDYSGDVYFNQEKTNIRKISKKSVLSQSVLAVQKSQMLTDTLEKNIILYSPKIQSIFNYTLNIAMIENLENMLGKVMSSVTLSGGQIQKTSIARMFYRILFQTTRNQNVSLCFLDEPFSAMDLRTGEIVLKNILGLQGMFKSLNSSMTIMVIDHTGIFLPHATKAIFFHNKKVHVGEPKILAAENGEFKKLYAKSMKNFTSSLSA